MWCLSRQIVALLSVLVVGGGLQPVSAQVGSKGEATWRSGSAPSAVVQNGAGRARPSDPHEETCEEDPGPCIFGTLLGYLVAPIFETLFTDLQGATQPYRAPLGVRLEH